MVAQRNLTGGPRHKVEPELPKGTSGIGAPWSTIAMRRGNVATSRWMVPEPETLVERMNPASDPQASSIVKVNDPPLLPWGGAAAVVAASVRMSDWIVLIMEGSENG